MWYVLILYYAGLYLYNVLFKEITSELQVFFDTMIPIAGIIVVSILGLTIQL